MKDIIVIGGGPGGYVAAIRAAHLGADVAVVEMDSFGGTCLNRGCIPTKTLYRTAEIINILKHIEDFGIDAENYNVNIEKVQERKNNVIKELVGGVEKLLKGNGVEIIRGKAFLKDKNTVLVETKNGQVTLEGKNIIIATGSNAEMLAIKGIGNKNIIVSDDILEFDRIPKDLVVSGGGVVGMEFANIFKAMGSEVTVIVARDSILYEIDREISKRYKVIAKKSGINILTSTKILEFAGDDNNVTIKCESKKGEFELNSDMVLMAKGRRGNFTGMNLEELGIEHDKKKIIVDDNYKTNIDGIYAIGDVNGICLLAHAASHQGIEVVEHIMGNKECHKSVIPNCIFTFPEIATVGMTEEEIKAKGIEYIKNKFLFGANGKALALGEGEGVVKVICEKESKKILGVHIMGPHASDLIHEGVLAIEKGMTVNDFKEVVHAHPTLGEAFYEAMMGLNKEAIHSINKK
ncbi:dihydrolipoyl dehydrogenase [Clostridium botulinum]|uniref:dihydrolipoyl dehydrogenase n=1 Tax=Clostridium botulinum TaxID=1491 RepID=UPI001788A88E|nr:dihydrolipoyl dehydrogenase [Clostridium botulinum]MBE1304580.1 dihydrolipoyl dehydrogenase [Clostridium botulinum]